MTPEARVREDLRQWARTIRGIRRHLNPELTAATIRRDLDKCDVLLDQLLELRPDLEAPAHVDADLLDRP